ncbi:ShlB/FhaC/HecB family hemolysin secretion/activation protein [Oscillatoria sp. FACHB-1407]|nr:ShlB/FhaC/HecB family hemolysin secretion/activation protein [Oscillatoria sp. FACHB-1407]
MGLVAGMVESCGAATLPKISDVARLSEYSKVSDVAPVGNVKLSPATPAGVEGSSIIHSVSDASAAPILLGQALPPDTLRPPSRDRLPEPQPLLPPPDTLLQPVPTPVPLPEPVAPPTTDEDRLFVREFEIIGNTVFTPDELATVTAPYANRSLTFAELLEVRSAITQLYVDRGYINSGAYIPPQTPVDGVLRIEVVEGEIEQFNITGTRRLRPSYVSDRLRLRAGTPFNLNQLVEGLRLLQLEPQIENITAELASSPRPGANILNVQVTEADPFSLQIVTNNGRSPAVGSWRRGVQVNQANLLGVGDTLSVGYTNTRGSNAADLLYTVPINPRNGTLSFSVGIADSSVIEEPFNVLDIQSDSRYYELTYRQPLVQTPTEEFALSLTASRQESRSEYLEDIVGESIPFPVAGSDAEGRTRLSILQFSQDWTHRGNREVLAARSQFSFGLDALDATVNEVGPDGRFFSWRGQGQWVRLLAPDTLFLLRGEVQLADSSLVSLEQFGLGGQTTVRGYRQDTLLTDNGVLVSAEVRLPILRSRRLDGVLQIVPFIDFGSGWNANDPQPDPRTLLSAGLGLQWQMQDTLTARIDWGIPLVDVSQEGDTWQENGVYFSIVYSPF